MAGLEGSRLGRWDTVVYDVAGDELLGVFADGRRLPFRLLSDGVRNMLALVADVARRAATLNPHLGADAARKTPGVVLIDEVDLHLHPRWQRRVLDDLRRTFPLVQFVATTHSPFIVQSLGPGELLTLDKPEEAAAAGVNAPGAEDMRKKSEAGARSGDP
jgi:predicted ATP-binding protein involved in virulence